MYMGTMDATLSYATQLCPNLRRLFIVWGKQSEAISTLTRTFICQQLETFSAVALKAANGVPAEVFATAVVKLTLVDICG